MTSATAIRGILRTDLLRVARDRFLLGMIVYVVGISIALRWILPWIAGEIDERFAFDFRPYFPLVLSHFVIQLAPFLGGIIAGFLLLEAKEDRTLRAQLLTPVPLSAYLWVLGAATVAFTVVVSVVEGTLIGLGLPPLGGLVGAALAGSPAAIMVALFIGAFSESKTEAFAFMKILGAMPLLSTFAYFLPEPWQWLVAIYPPYCASKAFWLAEATGGASWLPWCGAALVGSSVWIFFLWRAIRRAAHR
jgi:fluoroquinolone transport system permease protein